MRFAAASTDTDGVGDVEEAAAPNAGDGNNDGVSDSVQEAVTSLEDPYIVDPDITTNYVTVDLTNADTALVAVEVVDPTTIEDAPLEAGTAQSSLISFTVNGLPTGAEPAVAVVDLYVPARANSFWKYDESRPESERWIDATSIAAFATVPPQTGGGRSRSRSRTVVPSTSTGFRTDLSKIRARRGRARSAHGSRRSFRCSTSTCSWKHRPAVRFR